VDNSTDLLLPDQGPVRRHGLLAAGAAPRLATNILDIEAFDVPLAEHGFSMRVTVTRAGHDHHLLFDAGMTPNGMRDNMRRLGLSPLDIELAVLSHGHSDHVTGMDGLIRTVGPSHLPLVVHPGAFTKRRIAIPGLLELELPSPSRAALREAGLEVIERRQPSLLFDNSVLITGEVDRTSDFEHGMPFHDALTGGSWVPDPLILDDQALIVNVAGHGLVVLTGCGHAGIVNIVRYARRLTGVDTVAAVRRRLPPQRSRLRTHHQTHRRRVDRDRRRGDHPGALHRMARRPRPRPSDARRLHSQQPRLTPRTVQRPRSARLGLAARTAQRPSIASPLIGAGQADLRKETL
jgi:7,8-dihydropterin-6-yl-methyl-4-(beta-D-ribofuranosyl)aminobenzene 5'-phosphate synthase